MSSEEEATNPCQMAEISFYFIGVIDRFKKKKSKWMNCLLSWRTIWSSKQKEKKSHWLVGLKPFGQDWKNLKESGQREVFRVCPIGSCYRVEGKRKEKRILHWKNQISKTDGHGWVRLDQRPTTPPKPQNLFFLFNELSFIHLWRDGEK